MGIEFQMHRAAVDIAEGLRQVQKADAEFSRDNIDSTVKHYNKGLDYFTTAMDHVVKAEDDAYAKAGEEIDKGNKEMNESIDSFAKGHTDSAQNYYLKAMDNYDRALDLIG